MVWSRIWYYELGRIRKRCLVCFRFWNCKRLFKKSWPRFNLSSSLGNYFFWWKYKFFKGCRRWIRILC